jgi:hypothetical protein
MYKQTPGSSFLRRQDSFYDLEIAHKAPDEEDDLIQSLQRHKTFNPDEIPAFAGMTINNQDFENRMFTYSDPGCTQLR